MKSAIFVSVCALASAVQAASVTYNYNESTPGSFAGATVGPPATSPAAGYSPTPTIVDGSGFTVSSTYVDWQTNTARTSATTDGSAVFVTRYGLIAGGSDTTNVRAYRYDRLINTSTPDASTISRVEFAISTANPGQTFDLTGTTFSYNLLAMGNQNTGITAYARPYVSADGVTYVPLGSVLSAVAATTTGSSQRLYERTGPAQAQANQYSLDLASSGNLSLSTILSIQNASTLYFRLALGNNIASGTATSPDANPISPSAAPGIRATGIDNLSVSGFTVVPEPTSLAVLGLGGLMLGRRRR